MLSSRIVTDDTIIVWAIAKEATKSKIRILFRFFKCCGILAVVFI